MYIRPCEKPLRLRINGRYQYVACGKCPTCQNRRASRIVERLTQESQCHPYTVFFTLTYDECNVPKLYLNPSDDAGTYTLCDPKREVYIDTSDIKGFSPSSRLYIHRRKEIPYAYIKDVQDFFKRLRYYIESSLKYVPKENKKIRYYVVSEYGPTTFRPHYHGLLWFDSRRIAERIDEFIRESWTFGRIDAQFAVGKSEQYVARYVSCTTGLPKVYLHRALRPRSVSSSSPAIGTLSANEKEVRDIFERGSVERVLQIERSHAFKVSPLWRTFEARLFPKLAGFSEFTHNERVTLYSVYRNAEYDDFVGFCGWIEKCKRNGYDTWLINYLYGLLKLDREASSYVDRWSRLRCLYYQSARVYHQRMVFGVSLDYYVCKIEDYYNHKEMYKLRNFYAFQETFSRDFGSALPLVHMYIYKALPVYDKMTNKFVRSEPYYSDYYLETFGFDCSTALSKSASWDAAKKGEEFNSCDFINLNHKIWFDNTKTRKRNDYLDWCVNKGKFNFNLNRNYE